MKFLKFSLLFFAAMLFSCSHNPVLVGGLDDDVYYLDLPFWPPADMKVYMALSDYDIEVDEYVNYDYVRVEFESEYKHGNSLLIELIPTRMKFSTFERRSQEFIMDEYEDEDHAKIKHIYQEETRLNKHPALYNVYVVEYDNSENRTVIMQYLINYKSFQANLIYYANTLAENDPIFSPRIAIEKTYMPAYEFFRSLRVRFEEYTEEDEEEYEETKRQTRAKM
ncbi:MAG: hypothetical protein WC748_02750 [Legionellales bacterium]|jgi:hypothetical protein